MHSLIVLALCLRVNGLKREWWLDLPELTSIRLGNDAFNFNGDDSSELIMRSGDDEMSWWIDLPKLTTLAAEYSYTFCNPRSITLEGLSYHSILTNRHALSHHCHSLQGIRFLFQENRSHQEFLSLTSLIPRHHSRFAVLSFLSSLFHILFINSTLLNKPHPLLIIHTPPCRESLPQATGHNRSSSTLTLAPTWMPIITWNPLPSSGCLYHASM